MSELDRDNIIRLLERLGSDDDAEVLKSAREAHNQVTGAGVSWGDILTPPPAIDAEQDKTVEEPDDDKYSEETIDDSESNKIIQKLLARSDISEYLREELEGYKQDITDGEFTDTDRRYLKSLYKRLNAAK